jgi:hypothetical protein
MQVNFRCAADATLALSREGWRMENAEKLRELASWYRDFAEEAENAAIWDSRLRTAEDLEAEAERIEQRLCRQTSLCR